MATTIEEVEECDSLFSKVLCLDELKMNTPVTTKVKSLLDLPCPSCRTRH